MRQDNYKKSYEILNISKTEPYIIDIGFGKFCIKNWFLILALFSVLLIVLIICCIFTSRSENFSTAVISILCSAMIYVGISILTVMQYYQSWQSQQIERCNRTIHLDIEGVQMAEKSLIKKTKTPTVISAGCDSKSGSKFIFKLKYYNKSNFKIIDFQSLHIISIDKKVQDVRNIELISQVSSEFDDEYKSFECDYEFSRSDARKLITNSKIFIIMSTVVDEFYQEYMVLHCFRMDDDTNMVLSNQVLKREKFCRLYGLKFNNKFVRTLAKTFEID